MPMLRPSDLVGSDESGSVVALHPLEIAAVRFRRGTFLIPIDRLCPAGSEQEIYRQIELLSAGRRLNG